MALNTKKHQAKLGGVRLFRLFLENESPKEIIDHLFEHGIFLFNLKPSCDYEQKNLGLPPLCNAQFKLSALRKGDFDTVARLAVSSMGEVIGRKSRESMAERISDYMKSCFKFHGPPNNNVLLPRLVFLADVFVDLKNSEEGDDFDQSQSQSQEGDDGEKYEDETRYQDNNYNVHDALVSSLGAEKYGTLEEDDIVVLHSWYTKFQQDIAKLDTAKPESNYSKMSQDKVQSTFKLIIPTLQVPSKEFGEDVMCSLYLDKHCDRRSLTDLWV